MKRALLLAVLLLAPALQARPAVTHPVRSAGEARGIAERETGGIAVRARQVPLNGATGGWEVDLWMPGEDRGWRCIVDRDTRTVHTRTRIPNPGPPKRGKRS